MPLPKFTPADSETLAPASETNHYFDIAHGDVAALHARIERSLIEHQFELPPVVYNDRFDSVVRFVSRSAGVVGLAGALGGIAYALL